MPPATAANEEHAAIPSEDALFDVEFDDILIGQESMPEATASIPEIGAAPVKRV